MDRKTSLLNRLLDAAKECQEQYSVNGHIMTERNSCVSCVCRQLEEVLSHGLKRKPISSSIYTLQSVTGLQLLDQQDKEPSFWYVIQKHLSKHELERFMNLYHITSNVGRARAWLRSALNEHSLERTFQMLLGDTLTLEVFYMSEAFLLDKDKASLLPQIAGGLRSVMFSIKIDDLALNNSVQIITGTSERILNPSLGGVISLPSVSSILGAEVGMEEFPEASFQSSSGMSSRIREQKKEKKKTKKKIISFTLSGEQLTEVAKERKPTSRTLSASRVSEDDENLVKETENASSVTSEASNISSQFKLEMENDEYRDSEAQSVEKMSSDANDMVPVAGDSIYSESIPLANPQFENSWKNEDVYPGSPEVFSSPSIKSVESTVSLEASEDAFNGHSMIETSDNENSIDIAKSLDTKLVLRLDTGSDISSPGNSSSTSYETPVKTYSGDEHGQSFKSTILDLNSHPALKPIDTSSFDLFGEFSAAPASLANSSSSHLENQEQSSDLQKALVVLLQRKDELTEEIKVLKELLDTERCRSDELLAENENLMKQLEEFKQTNSIDTKRQLQENEVLKSQLKRYVGAVQALQQGKVGEPILNEESPAEVENELQASKGEPGDKVYERKLIEVTEMHGELMEFTEALHTRFLSALALIHKMHDELVSLRGPLPTDNVIKAIEMDQQKLNASSLTSLPRALVNVWVPSAFMQGSGPESHHVYQIYTCLGEDEWNVYRRYSDFYALHNSLSKSFPEVKQFGFPRKKGIGNRNSKIVEERRKAFQAYLRLVMHTVIQKNSRLSADPTKKTLVLVLPFFSDNGSQCRVIVGKHK